MPLEMNREVFITCAVTGSGGTQDRSPHVPRAPKEIADSAIEAAKAGAAVVHCHVRDPDTGVPSRRLDLYREVTERIRDAEVDVVLNLTAGMGGDITFGSTEAPLPCNGRVPWVREIIRLGLIGGGLKPTEANALVKNYVDQRPFMESVLHAQAILSAAVVGFPEDAPTEKSQAPAETTPTLPVG